MICLIHDWDNGNRYSYKAHGYFDLVMYSLLATVQGILETNTSNTFFEGAAMFSAISSLTYDEKEVKTGRGDVSSAHAQICAFKLIFYDTISPVLFAW